MISVKIPVQNISCDSCERVISRLITRIQGAKFESISEDGKNLFLSCHENDIEAIKKILKQYNYLQDALNSSPVKNLAKNVLSGSMGFYPENVFLSRVVIVFGVLFVLLSIFQLLVFNQLEFAQKLWPVLALVPFGIVVNMVALGHARLLSANFLCNTGMMIGMTIGMMSGFMLGAIFGATNGMFVGSVAGMLVGMTIGGWAGKSVGVMGVLEGLMAGLMAGLMGPMLSVMMVTDNLVLFLYLLFGACTIVLGGMSYLVYREAGPIMELENVPSLMTLLFAGLVVLILVVGLAVFGPKSPIAWGAF